MTYVLTIPIRAQIKNFMLYFEHKTKMTKYNSMDTMDILYDTKKIN